MEMATAGTEQSATKMPSKRIRAVTFMSHSLMKKRKEKKRKKEFNLLLIHT